MTIAPPSLTPDPTANWKTYINTTYNYSIKYPSDWTLSVEGDADPSTFTAPYLDSPCRYEAGDRCGQIGINIEEYDLPKTLEDYLKITTTNPWPDKVINKTSTKLDGEDAISMEWFRNNYFYGSGQNEHGIALNTIKAIHAQKVYSISISEVGKDRVTIKSTSDWKNNYLYNQILSTFKFIDQRNSNPTKTLKTYTDQNLNFSFDYPASWIVTETISRGEKRTDVLNQQQRLLSFNSDLSGIGCMNPPSVTKNTFQVGNQTLNWEDFCGTKNYFFGVSTITGKKLQLQIYFIEKPEENMARELLKSIKNLTITDKNLY